MKPDSISQESSPQLDAISRQLFKDGVPFVEENGLIYRIRSFPEIYRGYSLYSRDKKGFVVVYKNYGCLTRPYS